MQNSEKIISVSPRINIPMGAGTGPFLPKCVSIVPVTERIRQGTGRRNMHIKDTDIRKEYTVPLFVGLSRKQAAMKQSTAATKTINGIAVRTFAALFLF